MARFKEIHKEHYKPIAKIINDRRWAKTITEVMVNGPKLVFVDIRREGLRQLQPSECAFATQEYFDEFCQVMAAANGSQFDRSLGVFSGELPDGNRCQANIGASVGSGFMISIRVSGDFTATLDDFGMSTEEKERVLSALIEDEATILISGGTSSGKTTLLNALLGHLPQQHRVLIVEDKQAEIDLPTANSGRFIVPRVPDPTNCFTYNHVVDSLMRHRPDHIVMSEISIENAFPTLKLMGTGHGAFLSTIHANDEADAFIAFKQNIAMSGLSGGALNDIYETLASRIDLVIQVKKVKDEGGKEARKVTGISTAREIIESNMDYLKSASLAA